MVTLAMEMEKQGHSVEFFIYHPSEMHFRYLLEGTGIVIHQHERGSRFSPSVILSLRRHIQFGAHDIVLSYLNTPNFYAEVASIGRNMPPLVISQRDGTTFDGISTAARVKVQFHRLSDHIIVNSNHKRELMKRKFPWMSRKISTITNGVDLAMFAPMEAAISDASRKRLSLLAVGRIDKNKNAINLIRAIRICRDRYGFTPQVDWVGREDKSDSDGRHFSELLRMIVEEQVSNSWRWLGERTDMPSLYGQYDALIHPSLFEGFPNVICEALASGRPVLASDIGDHAALVQDGLTGFLFDPTQPEKIAEAMNRLACISQASRAEMGQQARKYAEEELSLATFVDRHVRLFKGLVGIEVEAN